MIDAPSPLGIGPGGPPGPDEGPPPQDGPVTMYTQAAIQALHDAIAHEPDAADKQMLGQALQITLRVQAKNTAQAQQGAQGGGAAQALAGQLGA